VVVLRIGGHDRDCSSTCAVYCSQVLSTTTWLICERVVGWQGLVVYQVRIPRVLPIGDSSSKTGSKPFGTLLLDVPKQVLHDRVDVQREQDAPAQRLLVETGVGISIRSDARKRSTSRIS